MSAAAVVSHPQPTMDGSMHRFDSNHPLDDAVVQSYVEFLFGKSEQERTTVEAHVRKGVRALEGARMSEEELGTALRSERLIGRMISLGEIARQGLPPVEFLDAPLAQEMIYAGKTTLVTGRHESGKTSLMGAVGVEYMQRGGHVLYFDWENGEADTVRRLLALGADADMLDEFFHYAYAPDIRTGEAGVSELEELWEEWPGAFAIWDSFVRLLGHLGLDENSSTDVSQVMKLLNGLCERVGATHALIDHVTKTASPGDPYAARGSSDKEAGVWSAWTVEKKSDFSPGEIGEIHVHRKKQRLGGLRPVFRFRVGDGEGGLPFHEINAMEAATPEGKARRKIVEYLREHPDEEFTQSAVEKAVGGRGQIVRQVLAAVAADVAAPVAVRVEERGTKEIKHYRFAPVAGSGALAC